MNRFKDFFTFRFTQIWFFVLFVYVWFINPTEAGREHVIPWICLGLVGFASELSSGLRRLNLLQMRLQALEGEAEKSSNSKFQLKDI
ncbi:MAG: hypothetical protein DCF25_19205 [Leptolyngbya foveolarum]|uniref:Uncharacterized protein n=1 Tax=Leptolyngbya foveolarum TaxID=47253 RepID=A0A2W4TRE4_9CYAN|nr:MAG: hypothetical protein DCF25_19205 [Leptolyngbya foveolarum]